MVLTLWLSMPCWTTFKRNSFSTTWEEWERDRGTKRERERDSNRDRQRKREKEEIDSVIVEGIKMCVWDKEIEIGRDWEIERQRGKRVELERERESEEAKT